MTMIAPPIQCLIIMLLITLARGAFLISNSRPRREKIAFNYCHHNINAPRITQAFPSSQTYRVLQRKDASCLHARPQDNLVAGISEIGFGFSLGVLWSEYSIILTGCGPLNFSDTLERICYQGMIVLAGIALFNRIVTGKGLDASSVIFFGQLEDFTLVQVRAAEYASALAVLGAFATLAFQYSRGENMDGLSGIDISLCRAIRDL